MSSKSKIEFAVQMTCNSCVSAIKSVLTKNGINETDFTVDLEKELVVVETELPSDTIKSVIEETGRRAVIKGLGGSTGKSLGAAVAMMAGTIGTCKGVVRMVQTDETTFVIDGTIDGLPVGHCQLAVHQYGDISNGCESCGGIYGCDNSKENPIGVIGEISAADSGRSTFRFDNKNLRVWDLIGRSIVVSSIQSTSSMSRLACGIIARSAGLFQNTKRICACDGVTLWDERDVPIAGPSRSKAGNS
ncbi:copper chaperone for superoxide dismutase-like [Tubulanus polymorphus]|uniref:copper chaperone for superoxide dismutase-like n=1 Tax=Tubulanus polymorphus TaxID=672921 RepID=UPI003DA2B8D5